MPEGGVGRQIDEELAAAGIASSRAAEIVIAGATSAGFSVSAVGPTQYRMSRTYRASWVVPAAVVGVVFFGLGLLLLLLVPKRNETCLATVHEGPRGVTVRLSGVLPETAIERIRADLTRGASLQPQGLVSFAPAPSPPTPSSPTPPVPAIKERDAGLPTVHAAWTPIPWIEAEPLPIEHVDATVARSPAPSVRIGGDSVSIGTGVVIGRNPAALDELPGARLVAVGDPALSKSHLAIRAQGSAVEVCDLSSTNGTLVDAAGLQSPCVAGVWRSVPGGATIVAGDQRFETIS